MSKGDLYDFNGHQAWYTQIMPQTSSVNSCQNSGQNLTSYPSHHPYPHRPEEV